MIDIEAVKLNLPSTPAFIIDEDAILKALDALVALRNSSGCRLLYSIKSLPLNEILSLAQPFIDGFSVSSLFEARLAGDVSAGGGIHLCTPGIRPDEIPELAALCTHISCNSIGQFNRIERCEHSKVSLGIRVNPQLSFTADPRYDPCRPYSKLGVELDALLDSDLSNRIEGLHFHTVFGETSYRPLLNTLDKIRAHLTGQFAKLRWINIGGGYLYDQIADNEAFCRQIRRLQAELGITVFIEPGNAVVGKAGYLVASVIDCFESGGKSIAVLDTSINHLPEVFEYQRPPALLEHVETGEFSAWLAGSTCLAGDLFGEYRFKRPLRIGDRLTFSQAGAYTLVKANRFNGYNFPDIYTVKHNRLQRIKRYRYQDYRQQWLSDPI